MKELEPIPTPPEIRWREFRIRYAPILVFLLVATAAAWIWNRHVTPPMLVGQVETEAASVSSAQSGVLANLRVAPFDSVRAGETVAIVITTDPKVLEAQLAVIRAELDLMKAQIAPLIDRERIQVDYERLRLEWLDSRVDLAAARAQLQYAEAELARMGALYRAKTSIVSKSEYELALARRDSLQAQIAEQEKLVQSIQRSLQRFQVANPEKEPPPASAELEAAISLQDKKLKLAEAQLSPLTLAAPIDGIVSAVYRRSGETVVAGEPILAITSTNASRIVAFLLPPWTEEIQPGSPIEVVRRSARRETARAKVTYVGAAMQAVPPAMIPMVGRRLLGLNRRPLDQNTPPIELGLPILVSVPPELHLLPGELVDLRYRAGSLWRWSLRARN